MSPFVMLTKSRFYVNTDYTYPSFLANKTERQRRDDTNIIKPINCNMIESLILVNNIKFLISKIELCYF